jgi:uncharacterized protein DUF1257
MSHIAEMDLDIYDLDSLEKGANELGLVLNRGQKTYHWFGRSVGDYPLPEGFTNADLGKCDHAISIPGDSKAYEIGVVEKDGKYVLLWDFWNGGYGMEKKVGKDGGLLKQQYAAKVAIKELRRAGFQVSQKTREVVKH